MRHRSVLLAVWGLSWVCVGSPRAVAQSDVADVPCSDIHIQNNEKQRYFLIGPAADAKPPKAGFKLLLILPGGDGGADFNPFVRRIWKKALSKEYVVAQLVAPQWSEAQAKKLVWPTHKQPCPEMKFDTETFVADVIADVRSRHRIDDAHLYALAWSSSGPAVHAVMLQENTPLRGAFIAMSVFRTSDLPDLKAASGRSYYLYQSRGDKVCKFSFAETAQKLLETAGARVTLAEYDGGHGWHGDVFGDIRRGMDWLESKDVPGGSKAAKAKSGEAKAKPGSANKKPDRADKNGGGGSNLVANGDFENGLEGWTVLKQLRSPVRPRVRRRACRRQAVACDQEDRRHAHGRDPLRYRQTARWRQRHGLRAGEDKGRPEYILQVFCL